MLPAVAVSGLQPAMVRGLYGYDVDKICYELPHALLYQGRRKADGLPVLIKLLRDKGAADGDAAWLERDYQIAQDLDARHAAKPQAFEQTDCGPALVYPDEGARPLEALAAKAPLDLETALTVGAAIGEAVASLHKERVVHCNLNPITVWLHEGGGVLISDFGCALRHSEDRAKGTPSYDDLIDVRYMSPEQSGRLECVVDQRTDIYSLGIILFRLLTGKLPFDDPDPLHIIDGHVARQPVFPPESLSTLPTGLIKVLSKALAKSPEARYLNASGLVADLIECRSQWRSTGTVQDFEPGRYDAKAMLRASRQLYGREREIAILSDKAKSAQGGKPGLLLIKGAAGVGKSALLGQLEISIRKENGRFVSGKFDQFKRNVPYLALIQALQQLIGQLLGGTKDELDAWRSRILDAVGNNSQVVINVIPELELITGSQPPVPDLPPVQTRNRFNHVFANLIEALAPRDQLLCLVMDDLQWADAASLALLSHVLAYGETRHVLFVGAYRDNEVDPTHPLETMVKALQETKVNVTVLSLGALKAADILQLVRDTFGATATEARGLAEVLQAKSGGNALYLSQFLPYLCDEGLIAFDYGCGRWDWDLGRIQRERVTQDVLDLLKLRLKALHQDTRTILATAACIGSSFAATKVAVAAQRSLVEVMQCMMLATREGLILAVEDRGLPSDSDGAMEPRSTTRFRFLHDHVQQAAFDCIADEAKKDFRLQVGRRLLAGFVHDGDRAPPLYILSNLNATWELIADEEEKLQLARLNLAAGRQARLTLAYHDALDYISVGRSLLGPTCWNAMYDLAFELHSEAFECEYLTGNFERGEQLFLDLIANARTKLDTARVYRTKILLDTSEKRYEEALKVGIEALRLFGIRYPRQPSKLHLLVELMAVRLHLRGRKPHDLLKAKTLNDPEKMAVLQVLVALAAPAFIVSRDFLILTGFKIVNYSLRHGIAPASAVGFVLYGFALCAAMDDFKRGYEFGHLAIELAQKSKDPATLCKVLYLFILIKVWRDPRDEVFPLVERVRKLALEVGEHQYVKFAITTTITPRIMSRGDNLQEVLRLCEEHRPFIEQSKDVGMAEWLTIIKNCVLALQGRTPLPYSLSDGVYDESNAELQYLRTGAHLLAFAQYQIRLQLACLFDRTEEAQSLSDRLNAIVRSGAGSGFSQVADFYLYRGLVAALALSGARGRARRQYRKNLRHSLARLRIFAASNPHGFGQHEALIEAEIACLAGQMTNALKHYNRAIELAEAGNLTPVVGLANERAALLCLAHDQRRLAGWYLACARTAYADKWGATAKVAWLDRKYGDLLTKAIPPASREAYEAAPNPKSPSVRHQGESFDVAAALQASRIIATGESGDRVLTHLMQVIRVQAGAEAAHVLVLVGGKLRLEASATIDSGGVVLFLAAPADGDQERFSPAIVNFVLHTGEDLILADAGADARFAQCSQIVSRRAKSVLCCVLRHQGEVLGVIYLEHTGITGAFTGQKVEWIHLLATEVGLTIWSARLSRYRDYVHKFAPATVAKEIDANPASPNLEPRDCDVSILFGDLAGYTRMAEQMERRQLDALMNRIFSKFIDEIHRYEGTLLEIRGDELFVLFGDEDPSRHVWKAASAALAISRAAAGLREELSGTQLPIIVNMGINSGVASVGLKAVEASSGSRWRYGASGTVVNVAARVRELAREGAILVSADSAARVPNDFVLEDIGEHPLKNVKNPIRIYRLLASCSP